MKITIKIDKYFHQISKMYIDVLFLLRLFLSAQYFYKNHYICTLKNMKEENSIQNKK